MCLQTLGDGWTWLSSHFLGIVYWFASLLVWTWGRVISFAAPVLSGMWTWWTSPLGITNGTYFLLVTFAIILGILIGRPGRRDRRLLKEARQAVEFQQKNAGR